MKDLKTTTSITIADDKARINETTYRPMANPGRKNIDYSLYSGDTFKHYCSKKMDRLTANCRTLTDYFNNNTFNYFLTLSVVDYKLFKKILDDIRDADKDRAYVSIAAWTIESDLHYHIALNTNLTKRKLRKIISSAYNARGIYNCGISNNKRYRIKNIYNQAKLCNYFKKNINYDTKYVLKQTENTTLNVDLDKLRAKQLEILNYSKILTYSNNLKKVKVTKIKNATPEQVAEIEKNYKYKETVKFAKAGAVCIIRKFVKDIKNTTTLAVKSVVQAINSAKKVAESSTSAPKGSCSFIKAVANTVNPTITAMQEHINNSKYKIIGAPLSIKEQYKYIKEMEKFDAVIA
jgi:hypothetical protein